MIFRGTKTHVAARALTWILGVTGILAVMGIPVLAGFGYAMSAETSPTMRAANFTELAGWTSDNQAAALLAFKRSCARLLALSDDSPLDGKGSSAAYGKVGDWRPACTAAANVPLDPAAARRYFETWFIPVRIGFVEGGNSLFTGYFEPEMKGARKRGDIYQTPVLVFPPQFAAMRRAGQPLPTRSEINVMLADGRLDADNLALVWLADPVDAFFLHVQGSGRVRMEDGAVLRLAFSAKNERPYTSIGKVLIARGALSKDEVSMQTIKAWLYAHPDQIAPVLAENDSYIFFKTLNSAASEGPPGAEKIGLTPGRSIAIDRAFHPLGSLYWLDTTAPLKGEVVPLRRLMVAQDTGSAIKGLQRADVFWGTGDLAAAIAGRMQQTGELTALLPRTIAPVVATIREP